MVGDIFFEKKAIGCLFWLKTAPIPMPETPVSKINRRLKSGNAKTGVVVTTSLSFLKACSSSVDQWKESFFSNSVRGAAMEA